MQAFVDVIGAGIGNTIYEILTLISSINLEGAEKYSYLELFIRIFPISNFACALHILRRTLNEYTTGREGMEYSKNIVVKKISRKTSKETKIINLALDRSATTQNWRSAQKDQKNV